MSSKKFDVVIYGDDLDNDDLPGFAKRIAQSYDNGFRFRESFDAKRVSFLVFANDVDVAMSTAPSDYEPLPTLHDFTEFVKSVWGDDCAETENDKLKRLFHQVYEKYGVDISSAQSKHWSIFIDNAHKLLLRKVGTSRNINYGVIKELRDLENCICQIHDSSLLRGKHMNDAQFRTHANKLTTEALAKLGTRDESKSVLDHQADNSQLAAIPTMEQVQIDYEELKSLREANKRQGAIIDDLLRDKAELKAKADSLAESVMSITDMNSEIAEKCEGMMTVLDAKTLAYLAYNRGRSIGELHCTLDFENWWVEFRKENGFEIPELAQQDGTDVKPTKTTTRQRIADTITELAKKYFGWHVMGWNEPYTVPNRERRMGFRDALCAELDNDLGSVTGLFSFKGSRTEWVHQLQNQIFDVLNK